MAVGCSAWILGEAWTAPRRGAGGRSRSLPSVGNSEPHSNTQTLWLRAVSPRAPAAQGHPTALQSCSVPSASGTEPSLSSPGAAPRRSLRPRCVPEIRASPLLCPEELQAAMRGLQPATRRSFPTLSASPQLPLLWTQQTKALQRGARTWRASGHLRKVSALLHPALGTKCPWSQTGPISRMQHLPL